jgi:hypothetical protein
MFFLVSACALVCAVQAIRAGGLLRSALWLAGASGLSAILLYQLGEAEVALIEFCVGAGLAALLSAFAMGIAGGQAFDARPLVRGWLALGLAGLSVVLLARLALPFNAPLPQTAVPSISAALWQDSALDALIQIGLIFAGVLGVVALLAEGKAAETARRAEAAGLETLPVDLATAAFAPERANGRLKTTSPLKRNGADARSFVARLAGPGLKPPSDA